MTLGSHQRSIGKDQARFTPKWILDRTEAPALHQNRNRTDSVRRVAER